MMIHTMWSQLGGGVEATPHGFADVGTGPAGGAGGAGAAAGGTGGGTVALVAGDGADEGVLASGGGVAATGAPADCTSRRGARERASRVARTIRSRPLVASERATTPLVL